MMDLGLAITQVFRNEINKYFQTLPDLTETSVYIIIGFARCCKFFYEY